jgi:hypothetical protein
MATSKSMIIRASTGAASLIVGAAALSAVVIGPSTAIAGAKVSGTLDAVMVEAQNATIEEILAALGARFDLEYHSAANLTAKVNGTYQGSLRRVLTRLLDGRDFVIKTNDGRIDVTVLGPGGSVATKAQSFTEGPANSGPILQAAPPSLPAAPAEQPGEAGSDKAPAMPIPGMKIAEAPVPTPTPGPSNMQLPVPTPDSSAGVSPPMPTLSPSGTGPMPELRPSTATPPGGPTPTAPGEPTAAPPGVPTAILPGRPTAAPPGMPTATLPAGPTATPPGGPTPTAPGAPSGGDAAFSIGPPVPGPAPRRP